MFLWCNAHNIPINNVCFSFFSYSQFQDEYSLEQIQKSPVVHEILTKLQCCPTSDGAACCIVASESFVKRHGLEGQAVEIIAMEMSTDVPSSFSVSV